MGFVRSTIGGITGSSQAEAIQQGSAAQQQAAREAMDLQNQQLQQFREDLQPFRQFGLNLLPQAESLFGMDAGKQILNDPVFQALSGEARNQIEQRAAARGRTMLPETDMALQNALLTTGAGLLGQRQGSLLSALGIGQNAAAMTGSAGMQGAQQAGNLLQQIANSQAASLTGAAGARAGGTGNLIGLGLLGAGMMGGGSPAGGGSQLSTLAGLGALSGFGVSDERLKKNIKKIGSERGYDIYEFNYLWDDETHTGVMAQEVEKTNPGAVFEVGGYKVVNYGRL